MLDVLKSSLGERLTRAEFDADYDKRFAGSDGHDSWKLERLQHFTESGDAGWEAFARGDWSEATRLIENWRPGLEELFRDADSRGIGLYRVRVVEEPIAPYVQWELNSLRLAAEYGEKIRVVTREPIKEFETSDPLPELLTVGADTVYWASYDENGACTGATRFIDAEITARCVEFTERLYEVGEELDSFFQLKVAQLEPPGYP